MATLSFFLAGHPVSVPMGQTNCLATSITFSYRTLHDLLTLPPLAGKKIYALGTFEFGKMYGFPTASRFPNDFAAGILAETAVGPLILGASVGDTGHRKWFFQLGRVF